MILEGLVTRSTFFSTVWFQKKTVSDCYGCLVLHPPLVSLDAVVIRVNRCSICTQSCWVIIRLLAGTKGRQ